MASNLKDNNYYIDSITEITYCQLVCTVAHGDAVVTHLPLPMRSDFESRPDLMWES